MGRTLTLPAPGDPATNDAWGADLNADVNQINDDHLLIRKSADEPINSTTLQNDDHLLLPVASNGVYCVDWWLRLDGPAANDFKYSWTGPASATLVWQSFGQPIGAAAAAPAVIGDVPYWVDGPTIGTVIQHGTIAASTFTNVWGRGYLEVSAAAGNLQMQWAQVVAAASTTVRKGSWLRATRVA